jgi:hypothetical protein
MQAIRLREKAISRERALQSSDESCNDVTYCRDGAFMYARKLIEAAKWREGQKCVPTWIRQETSILGSTMVTA